MIDLHVRIEILENMVKVAGGTNHNVIFQHFAGILPGHGIVSMTHCVNNSTNRVGAAWCAPGDNFSKKLGRLLSLYRSVRGTDHFGTVWYNLPQCPHWDKKVVWYRRKTFFQVVGE